MDPEAALKAIRWWVEHSRDRSGELPEWAEQFDSLDEWLRHGGFLPKSWARPPLVLKKED